MKITTIKSFEWKTEDGHFAVPTYIKEGKVQFKTIFRGKEIKEWFELSEFNTDVQDYIREVIAERINKQYFTQEKDPSKTPPVRPVQSPPIYIP